MQLYSPMLLLYTFLALAGTAAAGPIIEARCQCCEFEGGKCVFSVCGGRCVSSVMSRERSVT
jgi:hypothetical protein